MKPLFQVGEEVILQSKARPQFNGEYTVHEVLFNGCKYFDRVINQFVVRVSEGYEYTLCSEFKASKFEVIWSESALKKKHKPSNKKLSEIINELNNKRVEG